MMRKIRVYLDTNMIHDFFVNQAIYVKRKEEPRIPKKFEFIISSKEEIEFITSFLTKAEIVRELISAHSMNYEDISVIWDKFLNSSECKYIPNFGFDEKIVDIASKSKMRLRTMINFLHLFIAMNESAYFVSGDKDIIVKIRENGIYNKAMTYTELRKFIEKGDD